MDNMQENLIYCQLMQEQGINLKKLCDGLCSERFVQYSKKGNRKLKIYVTNEERTCIMNLMMSYEDGDEEQNYLRDILEKIYRKVQQEEMYISMAPMYSANMGYVASIYGNIGEYEKSDEINRYILENSLRFHRGQSIARRYYSMWCNDWAKKKEGYTVDLEEKTQKLELAIIIADFFEQEGSKKIYKSKLELGY